MTILVTALGAVMRRRWGPWGCLALAFALGVLGACEGGEPRVFAGRDAPPVPRPAAPLGGPAIPDLDLSGWVERGEVEAIQVAVWRGGQLAAWQGAGPGGTSPMPIGSLTKLLTGATALRLAHEGRLDLRARVGEVLPAAAPIVAPGATVADLMAHRAGIVADWLPGMWQEDPPDWRRIPREMAGLRPLPLAGRWTQYSNVGVSILGQIVERATGQPYRQAVRAWILDPMASNLSFVRPKGIDEPPVRMVPAGGAYGTARDLGTLVALATGRGPSPFSEALAAQLCEPYGEPLPLDLDLRYGLGGALVHAGLQDRGRVCWHRGSTPGHGGVIMVLRDEDLAVAALARGLRAPKVAEQVALQALGADPLPRFEPPMAPAGWTSARFGTYVTELGRVTIALRGDRAHLSYEGRGTDLVPLLDGTYRMAHPPALRLAFARVEGLDLLLGIEGAVHERLGVRLPEVGGVPGPWRARLGSYRVEDPYAGPAGGAELALEDGRLVLIERGGTMEAERRIRHVLLPESDDEAVVAGLGRAGGSRVRAADRGSLTWRGLSWVPGGEPGPREPAARGDPP